ncbi:MAG TPA: helix-hairpin-helix domain-containing protein [Anaerolineae bacterium]|nr:helix-hairpin-helix domain-containing protein [Anaerolineae bacterium]HQK14201.1 helix-hairpin-helix domain-containing protein [Anaerolineae bacterium]
MNWLSFFIGMLVGWLAELLIDFLFWRRRRGGPAWGTDVHTELAETEAKVGQLEAQLAGCRDSAERLSLCERDLQACTNALQNAKEQLAAREAEVQQLQAALASTKQQMSERAAALTAFSDISPNNLQRIEGIGPKIAEILNAHGIYTFADLAQTDVARLREILEAAGPRYRLADPETWPEQAQLAANGDWERLFELQSRLKGGRHKPL